MRLVIKQAASRLKQQQHRKIIASRKVVQQRKSESKWMTQSKSNTGYTIRSKPNAQDIVLHLHKENHLWVFNNVGKVAFCCFNSGGKCHFVLTVGIRKAQFVHPGGNKNRPKTPQRCFAEGSLHISGQPDLSQQSATGPVLEGLHPTMMVEVWALSGPKPAASVWSTPRVL